MISLLRHPGGGWAIYVVLRKATRDKGALGFVVKSKSAMLYSDRKGKWKSFTLGPLYFRSYR